MLVAQTLINVIVSMYCYTMNMTTTVGRTNVSLPSDLVEHIDSLRGDIPRSKFVLRAVERGLEIKQPNKKKTGASE